MLYFENLTGVKEDEYFRDGITEDIITELSKIKGLNIFSRPTVLAYRDKPVTPAQIGQQLNAAYVLAGSLRRAGNRLRINAQLVDTQTDFPLWSERYDREMEDVFEVQDEIARKIAEALRVTLSPQEEEALAAKPTENLQAYDLYLRGKSYARRLTRQDLEFALQMFENAVALDPRLRARARRDRERLRADALQLRPRPRLDGAGPRRLRARPSPCGPTCPSRSSRRRGCSTPTAGTTTRRSPCGRRSSASATARARTTCSGARCSRPGRYQEVADVAEKAMEAGGQDYNVFVPIMNALGALGKRRGAPERPPARDAGAREPPEVGARGRPRPRPPRERATRRSDRREDAMREANLAVALRPNEAMVLYNVACVFCRLDDKPEALDVAPEVLERGLPGRGLGAPRHGPVPRARRPRVRAALPRSARPAAERARAPHTGPGRVIHRM